MDFLKNKLAERQKQQALRQLKSPTGLVDFCSNDYLGFAQKQGKILAPHGSTGSRLISGHSEMHAAAETQIASFHQGEAALLFNSGYDANLGFFACVPQKGDTVIYDQLCHASIRDGLRLGVARNFAFAHNNLTDLNAKLQQASGTIFVVVESIYSMDGDQAPLPEMAELCAKHQALLVVDEAHATGIFGPYGEGLCQALQVDTFARMHTFGKALGGHGAAVVGSQTLKDFLINFARSFIYTTALPPSSVATITQAYQALPNCSERGQIHTHISAFKAALQPRVLAQFIASDSPIQSAVVGGNTATRKLEATLQKAGFDVRAILHPTVAEGTERLRICLHSFNRPEEINTLANLLNQRL